MKVGFKIWGIQRKQYNIKKFHCHAHFDGRFSWDLFKDKIFALHLHDNDQTHDQHLLPFDGTMDWEKWKKT